MTGDTGMAGYRCRLHLCCGPCPECGGCDRVCGCAPPSPRLALVPPAGRAVRPCGTNAAYHRHLDRGEPACPPCLAAHSAYTTARRPPAVRRAAAASRTGAIAADIARRAGSGEMASLPPRGDLTAAYGASRATIGKALRAARDAGAQLPPARPPVPATEDVAAHLRHLRLEGRSELTIYARGRTLARLQAALPVPLAGATRDMLYEWRAGLTVTGPTVAGYLSHVMEYYGWLAGTGRRADDPARGLPVPPVPRRFPRPIGEDDLMRALDLAPDRVRLWLILAAFAGLRCKEIALLRREEIRDRATPPCLIVSDRDGEGHARADHPAERFHGRRDPGRGPPGHRVLLPPRGRRAGSQ